MHQTFTDQHRSIHDAFPSEKPLPNTFNTCSHNNKGRLKQEDAQPFNQHSHRAGKKRDETSLQHILTQPGVKPQRMSTRKTLKHTIYLHWKAQKKGTKCKHSTLTKQLGSSLPKVGLCCSQCCITLKFIFYRRKTRTWMHNLGVFAKKINSAMCMIKPFKLSTVLGCLCKCHEKGWWCFYHSKTNTNCDGTNSLLAPRDYHRAQTEIWVPWKCFRAQR